jgi:hypothetical protein
MAAMLKPRLSLLAGGLIGLALAGCGSSGSSSPAAAGSPSAKSAGSGTSTAAAGALSAEARSRATGDIPDNQIFLTYRNPIGHYTMLYPEGWAIKAHGADVTIADKNNIVRVTLAPGAAPTVASVAAELSRLKSANARLTFTAPHAIALSSGPAIKARYGTRSAPDPVTGRSVLLLVDRYELAHGSSRATVDLGTPQGVDNVDAYRKMIESFHWR